MTKLHPILERHPVVRAKALRLSMGFAGLFFQPVGQCLWTDAKDALDASHTWPLVVRCYDLLFLSFGITLLWIQYKAFVAVLTPNLLTSAFVVAVFYHVFTAAVTTFSYNCGLYHLASLPSITYLAALPSFCSYT